MRLLPPRNVLVTTVLAAALLPVTRGTSRSSASFSRWS